MRLLTQWLLVLTIGVSQIYAEVENLRVGRMIGSVRFALRGNADLMTLRPGQNVPANSSVVTGSNSSVDLHFPDGSVISVAPNTRFRLDKLAMISNTESGSFGIDYGKILSKITKLNKARDLQFTTPTAIAGVRGTIFGIDVAQAGEAKLLVTEGSVAFGNQEVPAGSMAVANKDTGVTAPQAYTAQDVAVIEQGVPGGFKDLGTRPAPAPVNDPPTKSDGGTGKSDTGSGTSSGTADSGKESKETKTASENKGGFGSDNPDFPFGLGFGYGLVTIDGATWTRFNLSPEIRIGKFGLGMDLELFLTDKGNLSSRGWEFSTVQQALDSLTRKLNYIRWNQKDKVVYGNDHLYFRFGTIQNFTLGQGLIMKGYANTVNFPAEKNFGMELALGNISPLKLGFEGVVNSLADLSRNGFLFGGRVFTTPLSATKIPIFNKLQIGASYAGDINQFASLKDSDGDGVPDGVDRFPSNKAASNYSATQLAALSNYYVAFDQTNGVDWAALAKTPPSTLYQNDYFGMWGMDMTLPLAPWFRIYGQFAITHDPYQFGIDTTDAKGWGIAAPAVWFKVLNILEFQAEFRRQEGYFQSGYFDRRYDASRAVYVNGNSILTRDNALSNYSGSGFYAGLTLNLFVVILNASYEQLFKDSSATPKGTLESKVYLNPELLAKVPFLKKMVGQAEAYFNKQRVDGLDTFFSINETVTYGFDLSLRIAGPVYFQGRSQVTYSLDSSGKVVQNNPTFNLGMVTRF